MRGKSFFGETIFCMRLLLWGYVCVCSKDIFHLLPYFFLLFFFSFIAFLIKEEKNDINRYLNRAFLVLCIFSEECFSSSFFIQLSSHRLISVVFLATQYFKHSLHSRYIEFKRPRPSNFSIFSHIQTSIICATDDIKHWRLFWFNLDRPSDFVCSLNWRRRI